MSRCGEVLGMLVQVDNVCSSSAQNDHPHDRPTLSPLSFLFFPSSYARLARPPSDSHDQLPRSQPMGQPCVSCCRWALLPGLTDLRPSADPLTFSFACPSRRRIFFLHACRLEPGPSPSWSDPVHHLFVSVPVCSRLCPGRFVNTEQSRVVACALVLVVRQAGRLRGRHAHPPSTASRWLPDRGRRDGRCHGACLRFAHPLLARHPSRAAIPLLPAPVSCASS